MSKINVNNISDESGAGNNLILANDGKTTIPGGTNRPQIVGYQQGSWTPVIAGTVNMGNTLSNILCTWARIGNLVTLYFQADFDSTTNNTAVSDQIIINNSLPYEINENLANAIPSFFLQSNGRTNNCQWFTTVYTDIDGTRLTMRCFNTIGTTPRDATLRGSVTYLTGDTTWAPINGATLTP